MRFFLTSAVIALALAACAPHAANEAPPGAVASVQAKGRGEVVVVQPEYAAVTIRHEAIPEFGMGAMTMEFVTVDAAQLADVKVGDQVTFELSGPTEIKTIEVMK